ncbi:MAG: methyltransferase domain-containing protein [Geobacteraceae bacterium]|nr:methyltransferase domain-containing protein [Geobacteraceae bacterium]
MKAIDKARVRRSFDRQAVFYDETVDVQKRVVEQLAAQLRDAAGTDTPGRVLDVGAGTGMLIQKIRALYVDSLLVGLDQAAGMGNCSIAGSRGRGGVARVTGDGESLPFADCSFDLVLSTSTFQWLNSLDAAFREIERVLASGGCFRFALFGGGTMTELRHCYRRALEEAGRIAEDRSHSFFSVDEVADALGRAGFSQCDTRSTLETEQYDSVKSLLLALRRIGAGNASTGGRRGLQSRRVMRRMSEIYQEEFGCERRIPVTYEVIWGAGRKA